MQNSSPDEVMCLCSGTTRAEIQSFFLQGLDQEAISRKTGALSGCAGCEWEIKEFLKELDEQHKA
ncbi:MAG TPA: (2Fe-2S)-binding protein [Methylophilaceae bacterium]|nr:(2Fe-2S)-binding protein [Methylophilaceae bacterium]HAJ72674.1 (2Fe-2S)-binding protein [Methylophilaceae bacterium]